VIVNPFASRGHRAAGARARAPARPLRRCSPARGYASELAREAQGERVFVFGGDASLTSAERVAGRAKPLGSSPVARERARAGRSECRAIRAAAVRERRISLGRVTGAGSHSGRNRVDSRAVPRAGRRRRGWDGRRRGDFDLRRASGPAASPARTGSPGSSPRRAGPTAASVRARRRPSRSTSTAPVPLRVLQPTSRRARSVRDFRSWGTGPDVRSLSSERTGTGAARRQASLHDLRVPGDPERGASRRADGPGVVEVAAPRRPAALLRLPASHGLGVDSDPARDATGARSPARGRCGVPYGGARIARHPTAARAVRVATGRRSPAACPAATRSAPVTTPVARRRRIPRPLCLAGELARVTRALGEQRLNGGRARCRARATRCSVTRLANGFHDQRGLSSCERG